MIIHLACAADVTYLPHAAVMLRSAIINTPGVEFRIHLLHGGDLPEDGCNRLRTLAAQLNADLQFLEIRESNMEGLPRRYFHRAAWYRLLIPDLLPTLDKMLYLDCDLIVTDSLRPLWETDISRRCFGAVINPRYPFMPDWPRLSLGMPNPERYVNSGVLLMNLERMRSERCFERMRDYAASHPENRYPDQDALNVVLHHECLLLHPRWNLQTPILDLSTSRLPFPPDQIREAVTKPAVIHFVGPFKPWQYLCVNPYRHLYYQHLRHTPWPVHAPEGRTFINILLRPLPITWQDHWFHRNEIRARFKSRLRHLRAILKL